GIPPRYAATGYGYMEIESDLNTVNDDARPYSVHRFFEKPDSATAKKFLRSKRHFWNAGIFVFQVRKAEELFAAYMPELWNKILSTDEDLSNLKSVYANIIGTSIDYGVMEKLPGIQCIPCDLGRSDVGSWDEIARLNEEF